MELDAAATERERTDPASPDPASDDEQPDAIYVMQADGSGVRKVVPDPGEGWPIVWAWLDRWPL